jgi:hypothetical protein
VTTSIYKHRSSAIGTYGYGMHDAYCITLTSPPPYLSSKVCSVLLLDLTLKLVQPDIGEL